MKITSCKSQAYIASHKCSNGLRNCKSHPIQANQVTVAPRSQRDFAIHVIREFNSKRG